MSPTRAARPPSRHPSRRPDREVARKCCLQAVQTHRPSAGERPAERHLVGVLEVAADREPRGEAGDPHPERAEHPRQIARRRVPLEVRIGRDDHLLHLARLEPAQEPLDIELVGADAVDRAQGAAEHVVAPVELVRAFDRGDVLRLLDDADHRAVAPRVFADRAGFTAFANIAADRAEAHLVTHREQNAPEARHVEVPRLHDVEGDALGRLRADAGQSPEFVDELLDDALVHVLASAPSPSGGEDGEDTD